MRTYLYMRSIYSEYINLRNPQFLISPLGSEWSFEPYCHCHSVLINYFFFLFSFLHSTTTINWPHHSHRPKHHSPQRKHHLPCNLPQSFYPHLITIRDLIHHLTAGREVKNSLEHATQHAPHRLELVINHTVTSIQRKILNCRPCQFPQGTSPPSSLCPYRCISILFLPRCSPLPPNFESSWQCPDSIRFVLKKELDPCRQRRTNS